MILSEWQALTMLWPAKIHFLTPLSSVWLLFSRACNTGWKFPDPVGPWVVFPWWVCQGIEEGLKADSYLQNFDSGFELSACIVSQDRDPCSCQRFCNSWQISAFQVTRSPVSNHKANTLVNLLAAIERARHAFLVELNPKLQVLHPEVSVLTIL